MVRPPETVVTGGHDFVAFALHEASAVRRAPQHTAGFGLIALAPAAMQLMGITPTGVAATVLKYALSPSNSTAAAQSSVATDAYNLAYSVGTSIWKAARSNEGVAAAAGVAAAPTTSAAGAEAVQQMAQVGATVTMSDFVLHMRRNRNKVGLMFVSMLGMLFMYIGNTSRANITRGGRNDLPEDFERLHLGALATHWVKKDTDVYVRSLLDVLMGCAMTLMHVTGVASGGTAGGIAGAADVAEATVVWEALTRLLSVENLSFTYVATGILVKAFDIVMPEAPPEPSPPPPPPPPAKRSFMSLW